MNINLLELALIVATIMGTAIVALLVFVAVFAVIGWLVTRIIE